MYLYGEDKEYTQGWDDCEEQVVQPLEEEIKQFKELLSRYEAK